MPKISPFEKFPPKNFKIYTKYIKVSPAQTHLILYFLLYLFLRPRGIFNFNQSIYHRLTLHRGAFASFFSTGFITVIVINTLKRKLARCSSVHLCNFIAENFHLSRRFRLMGFFLTIDRTSFEKCHSFE